MTPQEFREAYLEAQNGLGNDLQALISLSHNIGELAAKFNELAEATQNNYARINQVVEEFINTQEDP